jgi:Thiamine biosynthesis enzyme ThiH and related uncharacterized enzymes
MNKYRIGKKDALSLFKNDNIIELGKIADGIRKKKHPDDIVTFIIDRNINYTNVCISECKFCAFYKKYGVCDDDAYVLTKEQIFDKIRETKELSGTQILLQGGLNPDITIDYYINLLNDIKENFDIHIHAFSPPEITFIARSNDMTIRETVNLLKEAGLNSVPGGGAEILVDRVRKK